jgi:hypothetical protein
MRMTNLNIRGTKFDFHALAIYLEVLVIGTILIVMGFDVLYFYRVTTKKTQSI